MSKIEKFFSLDNDKDKLNYFFSIIHAYMPSFLKDRKKLERFNLVWREDIIGIKYMNEINIIINEVTYIDTPKEINYFGV